MVTLQKLIVPMGMFVATYATQVFAQEFRPQIFAAALTQSAVACSKAGSIGKRPSFQQLYKTQLALRNEIALWRQLSNEHRTIVLSHLNSFARLSIACESGTLAAAFEPELFDRIQSDVFGTSLEVLYARYLEAALSALQSARNRSGVLLLVQRVQKTKKIRPETIASVLTAWGHELFAQEDYQLAEQAYQDALAAEFAVATQSGAAKMLMARYISQSRQDMVRGLATRVRSLSASAERDAVLVLQSKNVTSPVQSPKASEHGWVTLVKSSK